MSSVTLNNSVDVVANSISVIRDNRVVDLLDTVNDITGLAPTTLDSLEKLASALDNNPDFYSTVAQALDTKASTSYVDTQLSTKANASNVYTKAESDANISNLIGTAPEALNTLNELATALGNDANYASTIQNQLATKANVANVYDKTTIDTQMTLKADSSTVYTKTETDSLLAPKATITYVDTGLATKSDSSTVYTKTETDSQLTLKADKTTTYTITQTDNLLNDKSDKANTYTKTETDTQISNLVGSAPETLNTLNELAAALGNDENFSTTVSNQIGLKANQATTYTIAQTDTLLNAKRDVSSSYSITQTDNLLSAKANTADHYTKTQTDALLTNKQDTLAFYIPASGSSIANGLSVKGIDTAGPITLTDANNTLTLGLDNGILANDFEPSFLTIAPLQKSLNLGTGNFELKIDPTADLSINDISLSGNIVGVNATSTSLTSNKNLTLGQTGDLHGGTYLHLRNRTGENGMILETSGGTSSDLADLVFRSSSGVQRNIRLEARSSYALLGSPTWQISDQFHIGDTRAAVKQKLTVGTLTENTDAMHVNGDSSTSGNVKVGNAVQTDTIRGNGASQVTIDDNATITGNVNMSGTLNVSFDVTCGDLTCNALYGNVITQLQSQFNSFWVAGYCKGSVNPPVITYQQGLQTATVQRYSAYPNGGYFQITMPTHPRGSQYVPMISSHYFGNPRVWEGFTHTSTDFVVGCLNPNFSGVTNGDFWFAIYR